MTSKKPSYEELEQRIVDLENKMRPEGFGKKLRESRELFEKTFMSLRDAIFILDAGIPPKIIDCNPAAERIFGYPRKDMLNKTTDFLHLSRGAMEEFQRRLYPKILEQEFFLLDDFMMKRKDRARFHSEHTVLPLNNERGERTGWISVVRDVTRRKKAEEENRKSEARYRLVTERTSDLISITTFSSEPHYVYINPAHEVILGYKPEHLIGKCPFEFIHPEDSERLMPLLSSYFVTETDSALSRNVKEPTERLTYRLRDSWGNWRDLETTGDILDAEHILFISRDITERQTLENTLRESEERYRNLVEDMPSLVCRFLSNGTLTFANSRYLEYFNKKPEELIGQNFFQFIPEQDRKNVRRHFLSLGKRHPMVTYEHQVISPQGDLRWQQWTDRSIFDDSGQVREYQSVGLDVTDRRRAEDELRASEQKYKDLFNNALVGIYRTRIADGKVLAANYRMAEMFGYDNLNEFVDEYVFSEHYVDVGTRENLLEKLIEKGEVNDFEARFSRRDAEIIWGRFSARSSPEKGYIEGVAIDVTAEKNALSKLVDSETKYRLLVEHANDAIFVVQGNKIEFPNPKAREMGQKLGFDLDREPFVDYIHPDDKAMVIKRHIRRLQGQDEPSVYSFRLINDRGEERWVELNTSLITWEGKASTLSFLRDITAQKALEAELQQARRMEALGTLAGGVAHDFNNLLMGIQGRVSMMLMNSDTSHPHYQDLKDIEDIVKSGADLTKQLLGFSRGGRYQVKATDLNSLIKQTFELFGRTKKHIKIQRRFQKDLWAAEVDRGQFEQVLLNLFLNASEAMPDGGTLSLRTQNVLLEEEFTQPHRVPAGRFVHVSITDTGVGMDDETLGRIFEPFFTTKGMGRGTGLGLASVYGIIKNHGGIIKASSKLGTGTTFDIYLAASERAIQAEPAPSLEPILKGTERILLVDDEPKVLDICERFLKSLGYSVLTATNGFQALETYEKNKAIIDAVVIDMIMPGMNGRELFDKLRAIQPSLKALVSTGYSVEGEVSDLMTRGCKGYVQKPFSIRVLAKEIRRILDEK
jgi:two-component system, cell cycle sensor histidine kinase and response regulator CckA